ncbi:MAG: hypothetical protein ACREJC_11005 [Tepidisphaeraceae bacterium]
MLQVLVFMWLSGAQPAHTRPVVLVGTPSQQSAQSGEAWIARAVQEGVIGELARRGLSPTTQSESEPDYSVALNIQSLDGLVRISGEIRDVHSTSVVGGIKATGALGDVFALEDAAAEQINRAIVRALSPQPAGGVVGFAPSAESFAIAYSGPLSRTCGPDVEYTGNWSSKRTKPGYDRYIYKLPPGAYWGGWCGWGLYGCGWSPYFYGPGGIWY